MLTVLPHPRKQILFVLLSLADLTLTWWLLSRSGGHIDEGNPIARWWLARHGWVGLAGFKAAVVLLVLGLSAAIARSQPRAASGVLGLGCATLTVVVLYSASLCPAASASPEQRRAEENREAAHALLGLNREIQRDLRKSEDFRALVGRLCEDLHAGRCTLTEAVARLAESERGRDLTWVQALAANYPNRSFQERLAIVLLRHAAVFQQERAQVGSLLPRLERDFESTYGKLPPQEHHALLPRPDQGEVNRPRGPGYAGERARRAPRGRI
jgi:hypothetical protein